MNRKHVAAALMSLAGLITVGMPASLMVGGCAGTPDQRAARVAKAEEDLCKLRATERAVEAAIPGAAPAPDSVRARIESAEDAFCASRVAADAGASGAGGSS
jgi:hypothetical protein